MTLAVRIAMAGFLVLSAALASCATGRSAGPLPDRLPEIVDLVQLDGAPWDLHAAARTHRATVLVWWSAQCPCVARYEQRLADLAARFGPQDVAFAFIASNAGEAPPTDATAALPLVRDPDGRLARALGVTSTPTAVVLDPSGAVVFRGWVDNERLPGDPDRQAWLAEALDATLAGAPIRRQTPVWGCPVTRSLAQPAACAAPDPTP